MITSRNIRFFPLSITPRRIAYMAGPNLETEKTIELLRERFKLAEITLMVPDAEGRKKEWTVKEVIKAKKEGDTSQYKKGVGKYDIIFAADRSPAAIIKLLFAPARYSYYLDTSESLYAVGFASWDFWQRCLKMAASPLFNLVRSGFGFAAWNIIVFIIKRTQYKKDY